jgi:hypothetical protein
LSGLKTKRLLHGGRKRGGRFVDACNQEFIPEGRAEKEQAKLGVFD